ncbi:flagellar filament capping protein FliD [Halalkalibacterium halodurans]|uniref:flagellar filament capping protein FliD n=1 Tax=Halalkalibacterium halodurans TaxID=86665 RepID=UPI002E1D7AE5|nr:flagellar filament capping protein FliD [Halalkalibacterium halodurans]MED3645771.1 flagellar filament capping protein FliD [Halalkalibacterium halodurans]
MRIGGIASGIDTESMIKQLMQVERIPLNKFTQRKITLEWQRDAYREVNLLLKKLDDAAANIRLRSSLNTKEASTTSKAFTAQPNAQVRNGSYQLKVNQIATQSRNISSEAISNGSTKISTTRALNEQNVYADGVNIEDYDGQTFTITTYNSSGAAVEKSFTIDTSKSLDSLFRDINSAGLGVRMSYNSTYDKVIIERTETGAFNAADGSNDYQIVFGGETGFLNDVLKLNQANEVSGTNAEVEFIDPIMSSEPIVVSDSRTNRITVGGITFSLTGTTEGFETFNVSSNTDAAFEKVMEFVDTYNATITELRSLLSEPRYRDYPPLTEEQRRELSEREAELWDEKAKSGLLRNDSMLNSLLSQMRADLYTPVQTNGQFSLITQIGITTSSDYRSGGLLEVDEDKLRAALEDDPDSVHQLLNGTADSSLTSIPAKDRTSQQRSEIYSQTGLVGRIRSSLSSTMNDIVARAGNENRTAHQFTIGRQILDVDKQIDRFQQRLTQIENRYWAQFSRMEQMVNQANAQYASLQQFFVT